ncbi:acetyltransferase (GNAT) family protein [Murinocardiopsis flavida]|uniref:Acetyltransferase (GNAT) family protein n=1 Tax=Murinocardiopsis flavida TaxID=645275 RepID=A0A2P8DSA7_9ACTN|nr:GNAT family N-acetyltransferase [Murinocardiopsis flavida]PSL00097.1 acetyltransferase (GNAT) family protein [Murinocardiopsis flavida]
MESSLAAKPHQGLSDVLRFRYLGAHELDELSELWQVVHEENAALSPHLDDVITSVGRDESWRRRRARYTDWLSDPDTLAVLAERHGRPIGYAMVTVRIDHQGSWDRGERVATVQTLAVRPEEEYAEVGTGLLDEVRRQVGALGVRDLELATVAGHGDAIRFYEQQGFRPFTTTMVSRIGAVGPHD